MTFFLSAIYLFLLEMYYQHYVIFEALHLFVNSLKLYITQNCTEVQMCTFISFIKNGVFLIHIHTFTPFIILYTLLHDFWYLFPPLKKKRIRQDLGSHWLLQGWHSPVDYYTGFWFVFNCIWTPFEKTRLSSSHFPIPSPLHSFILPNKPLESWDFAPLHTEHTEDSIKLRELLPLLPVMSSWMYYNDITQSRLTQN